MSSNICTPEQGLWDSYLNSVENLPPTPGLMIQLISLFRQPNHDVDEIVELMRQDPSVTAELLRRCNSAFFGNEEPVTDVYEAVFRLGFYEVYRITVALFGRKTMSTAKTTGGLEVEALWWHSVVTAITGGVLARELDESETCAFTAGLLHDVGRMVLASKEGVKYTELVNEHSGHGRALNEAEKLRFGFDHGEVGARLLSRWGVPEPVFMPVLCHHQTGWEGIHARLEAIICLSDWMAHRLVQEKASKLAEPGEAVPAMEFLGITSEGLAALELLASNDLNRLGPLFKN